MTLNPECDKGCVGLFSLRKSVSPGWISDVVRRALYFKRDPSRVPTDFLKGKSLGLYFEKKSTRTRLSLSLAFSNMGGTVVDVSPNSGTHGGECESFHDSFRVIASMVDVIAARVFRHETLKDIWDASQQRAHLLNALCDKQHPLQILADLMTMVENEMQKKADGSEPQTESFDGDGLGLLTGLTVAWIGDNNNVFRELAETIHLFGMHLKAAIPSKYHPTDPPDGFINDKIQLVYRKSAVDDASYIMTDTFVSMGEERDAASKLSDFAGFGIDQDLIARGNPKDDWAFMHCLPRKVQEVTDDIFYSKRSLVFDQAENRLWIMYAVFERLFSPAVRIGAMTP